jgi:hypothetical protein
LTNFNKAPLSVAKLTELSFGFALQKIAIPESLNSIITDQAVRQPDNHSGVDWRLSGQVLIQQPG